MPNKYPKKLSIIIVSYNTKDLLKKCLLSLKKVYDPNHQEIIVVDNDSTDGSVEMLRELSESMQIELIKNKKNFGFGQANNIGMEKAKGKYILLLNSDTVVYKNTISRSIDYMEDNHKVGVLGCKLIGEDKRIQSNGGYFPSIVNVSLWMMFLDDIKFIHNLEAPYHLNPRFIDQKDIKEVDWVTGAYFLFRSEILESVGMFDRDYFMYVEEVDYCYRIKKQGWKIIYNPNIKITHYGGASGTTENAVINEFKGLKTFFGKHKRDKLKYITDLIKLGSLLRWLTFLLLGDRSRSKIYAKTYRNI